MTLICGNDSGNNSNNSDKDPDELYRNHLINTSTYVSILFAKGMTWDEIGAYIKAQNLNTLWETRNGGCG